MKIAVLCGGYSRERDVSLSTGIGAAQALRSKGHKVALVDSFLGVSTIDGTVDSLFTLNNTETVTHVHETEPDIEKLRAQRPGRSTVGPHVLEICEAADIVFLALHGGDGENGRIQAWLDVYGIPYTGSGYSGSLLAMDKELTKLCFRQYGIPNAKDMVLHAGEPVPADIPVPCVVKPCSGGSSVATAIVSKEEELRPALKAAFECEEKVLIEQYIHGREFTVGILNGKAMPVIEIIPLNGFYDYKNKYQAGLTKEICPAEISDAEREKLQSMAEAAFKALHLQAYGRADFIMDDAGNVYCLEVNTLPGMTPTSLIPQMAREMGMTYADLCEKLIEASLEKYKA